MERKVKLSCRDILGYLLLGISVLLLGRSLMLCFSNDIWYDELFTVGLIRHSYGELVDLTARDVHPPLYYMITKFFVDLCKLILPEISIVAVAKMVSVLPYFVLLLYSVTFIRKRFSLFAGGLFLFCSVAMPQLSGYTVEMRMYSWALLFVTAAFLHGYGAVHGRDGAEKVDERIGAQKLHGAAMTCYGLAAAYTQYFAAVAAAMVYLYVLLVLLKQNKKRLLEWFLWAAVSAAGYAAWLLILYRQITAVNADYWILPLSWRTFGGCVKFLMKPAFTNDTVNVVLAVMMTGVYAVVVVGYMVFAVKSLPDERAGGVGNGGEKNAGSKGNAVKDDIVSRAVFMAAGIGVLAGLVLFGFTASMLLRPIFVYRYMIPAMGCFWLSFAVGLDGLWGIAIGTDSSSTANGLHIKKLCKLNKGGGNSLGSVAVLFCTIFILIVGLRDYRAFMGEEEYKILLMKETQEALSSIAPEDVVVYNFDQVQAVTGFYLPAETDSYLWCGTPEVLIQDITRSFETVEEADTIKEWCEAGRTVWFIGSFNSRDAVVEEWRTKGLQIEETGSYLLERYWFNLYRISV